MSTIGSNRSEIATLESNILFLERQNRELKNSLRYQFIAAALTGLVSRKLNPGTTNADIAGVSIGLADAVMAALEESAS